MAQITTDPHENLIVSADIALEARKIDFVTQFAKNWDALREVMGITRPIRKANGTELYVKYAEGELQSGDVAEGAFIPRSHFTVKEKTFGKIKIEKYAKEVSVEAVADHGYDAAVDMTDEEFLVQLQDVISDRFYTQLKAGEMTFEEKTFQMAFAMALGKVKDKFKQMHRNVTGIAVFVNTLDLYAYLGSSAITIQTAFGFNYLENFLGAERTFISSEIPRGTMIATPLNNIISYYVDPGDSEFSRMGLQYTVDGETNLVGFAVQGDYDRATSVSYALMGFTLMAEYIDAIAVVTINPDTESPESEAKSGDTGVLGSLTLSSASGSNGGYKITVTQKKANGANVYKYKVSKESVPDVKYRQDLTNWDMWDGKSDIFGDENSYVRIVETTPAYKALNSGETQLTGGMIGTGQAYLPLPDQSPLGGITVSQMIADDVTVSKDGAVSGTIYYLSDVPQFDAENNDGHFFPVKFPEKNYKKLHVGGDVVDGQFVAGKEIEPSAQDPYLVIRTENCTVDNSVSVYDFATKEKLFTLNFSGANLQEKPKTISARRSRKVAKPLTE